MELGKVGVGDGDLQVLWCCCLYVVATTCSMMGVLQRDGGDDEMANRPSEHENRTGGR
jgi:hypothetical protein